VRKVVVDIYISPEDYQFYYSGRIKTVSATTIEGLTVHFPAGILQRVVTHEGVKGRFAITFTADNKFHSIERLD